ncbi:MAG: InlB B-repeat-containing protein [Oscillibacter sp.]|nr:InlB B-repeat-containing protein [Oscillibacter sp.]
MLKLGDQSISAAYLGGVKIKKAYLGKAVVFDVSEPPVPTYTITASVDPAGSGTVSGAGTYQEGDAITITAAPEDGYQFTGWQENGVTVSEDAVYTFTVTGDRTLTAVFEEVKASRLPAGYTEVEYIQNANTSSYINTGKALLNSTLTMEISAPEWKSSSTAKYLFNCNSVFNLYAQSSNIKLLHSSGSANTYTVGAMSTGKIKIDCSGKSFTLNGNTTTLAANNNGANMTFPNKTASSSLIVRIYYVKSVRAGDTSATFNFELIPCINPSGVVGLYDLTNSAFIPPTAGTFIAGPAV